MFALCSETDLLKCGLPCGAVITVMVRAPPQRIEFHVLREEDAAYDLDVRQRVYVRVRPMRFVAFSHEEVQSTMSPRA